MKRLYLTPLLLILAIATGLPATIEIPEAPAWVVIGAGSEEEEEGSCDTVEWSNTTAGSSDYDIFDSDSLKFCGNKLTPTSETTICKVTFYITYRSGDISGKTFRAYIYTMDGNNLDTGTEADGTITGDNDWENAAASTGSPVSFEWDSGYTMDGTSEYAIVITMDGTSDGSNYAEMEYSTSTALPSGVAARWNTSEVSVGTTPGSQAKMIIYSE